MRSLLAVLLTALLLAPMGALGESGTIWVDARGQQDAGTFGGLTLEMGNGTEDDSKSVDYNDLPNIVEVYTATWCWNCVTNERAMSEAVEGTDAVLIHYHRVWIEPEDPFGSDSTEERWVGNYGESSKSVAGEERIAPSLVVDGQRLHTGSVAKGTSLVDDYSQSLQVGNRAWFTGGTIDFSVSFSESGASFSWNFDNLVFSCADDCPTQTTTPWIVFVEDSANFEDGSNNFVQRNKPLGHFLGSDFEITEIGLSSLINQNLIISIQLGRKEEGNNSILNKPYNPYNFNYDVSEGREITTFLRSETQLWYNKKYSIFLNNEYAFNSSTKPDISFEIGFDIYANILTTL